MRLKTFSQNAEIKPSKVQTHKLLPLISKPAELEIKQSSSKATKSKAKFETCRDLPRISMINICLI